MGLTGLWCYTYWRAKSERDALLAEIRARGEPTTVQEIVDKLLAEPNENTGAEWLIRAARQYDTLDAVFAEDDPVRLIEFDFKKQNPTPGIHEIVEKRIHGVDEFMRLLEEAANRPPGVLADEVQRKQPHSLLLQMYGVTPLEEMLFWTSYDALARGDSDRAYRALWLRLSLFEQTSRNPFLTRTVDRLARVHRSEEHIKLCLENAVVAEPRFRQIDRLLLRAIDCFGVKEALFAERAEFLATLDDPSKLQEQADAYTRMFGARQEWDLWMESKWFELLASPLGRQMILKEQCEYLRLIEKLSAIIERPDVNWWEGQKAIDAFIEGSPMKRENGTRIWPDGKSTPMYVHQFTSGGSLLGGIAPNSRRRFILARLALRLRRHYDSHGNFPSTLEELCDESMPKISLEWFQNLPLVYKPRRDGFLLDVSDRLEPGPGFSLRTKDKAPHTFLSWNIHLKKLPSKATP
jgi:hypothetical protein